MANPRDLIVWQIAKRHGVREIRELIEEEAPRVAVALATVRQQVIDVIDTLRTQMVDALAVKAPLAHTHPRADITGLNAILNALDARLTDLETRVTALETPPEP